MRINREEIMQRTNGGLDIFQFVFNVRNTGVTLKPVKTHSLKNPFYVDTHPSLSVFRNQSGEYHYKDHGDENYRGDSFSFFAKHLGLDPNNDFTEICRRINTDILGEVDSMENSEIYQKSQDACEFEEGEDFQYWKRLFPEISDLTEKARDFGLVSLRKFKRRNQWISANSANPIFGFKLGKALKTYQPLSKEGFKHSWLNHGGLDYKHFLELIDPEKPVLITEGFKDAFSAFANDFNVFPIDNASSEISIVALDFFKKNRLSLLLCLDNDKAGQNGMEKLSKTHGIPFHVLCFEKEQKGKDLTDYLVLKDGKKKLEVILNSQASQIIENPLLCKLYKEQRIIIENSKGQINWTEPLINLDDYPLIYDRTINVIQGHAGTHKSRTCESIAAAAISENGSCIAGFKRNKKRKPLMVLYVDTERNQKDQLPYAIQQIRKLAGFDQYQEISSLNVISLIPFKRDERGELIGQYLKNEVEQTDRELLVILDVLTDCVSDFNNVGNSLNLIDLMNKMINEYKVTFITVIHSNPGSDKARGHLGTELMNKSSSALSLKNEESHIEGKVIKLRQSKRFGPVHFEFNEELKHLELSSWRPEQRETKSSRNKLADPKSATVVLERHYIDVPIPTKVILQDIVRVFGCSERLAEQRIKEIIEDEVIVNSSDKPCKLERCKRGFVILRHAGNLAQTQMPI